MFRRPRVQAKRKQVSRPVFVSKSVQTMTKQSLPKHIKHRFSDNESAWSFVFRYFFQYLPVLVQSYRTTGHEPCVIFDIDQTVLQYQSPLGVIYKGGPVTHTFELRLMSHYVKGLYELFQSHGIPIYFVTGRPFSKATKLNTEREFKALGLAGYRDIYFMPSVLHDVGIFKESVRDQLRDKHVILFNVGDQWTDVVNMPIDETPDDGMACLLFNVEPKCDWSLKLIATHHAPSSYAPSSKSPTTGSIFDSVFETFAPLAPLAPIKPQPPVCHACGHVH